ncbi:MAG: small multi-drug export protein [Tissierellaceae bacterium]
MSNIIAAILDFISIELTVILTAALPVIELRGAIPIGISLGLGPIHSFALSFMGSMIPVPFILLLVRPIFRFLRNSRFLGKPVNNLISKSMRKSRQIQRYKYLGLFIFVALPIPGTGVWTGSIIAAFMDMRLKWALPAIFLGNLLAGIIVMGLSQGLVNIIT